MLVPQLLEGKVRADNRDQYGDADNEEKETRREGEVERQVGEEGTLKREDNGREHAKHRSQHGGSQDNGKGLVNIDPGDGGGLEKEG